MNMKNARRNLFEKFYRERKKPRPQQGGRAITATKSRGISIRTGITPTAE